MTIQAAIERLEAIRAKHGDGISVLFDCPNCRSAFCLEIAKVVVVIEPMSPPTPEPPR